MVAHAVLYTLHYDSSVIKEASNKEEILKYSGLRGKLLKSGPLKEKKKRNWNLF
jgi:hypothetical protein